MRLCTLLLILLAGPVVTALAQDPLEIDAPDERLVAPGDFVTLVFRVQAKSDLRVNATFYSEANWSMLRQPGELDLVAGKSQPVGVTVAVPSDASAFSRDRITLELSADEFQLEASMVLTVGERSALELLSPNEVSLSPEGFAFEVKNGGNIADEVTLELARDGETLASFAFGLAPFETKTLSFVPEQAGVLTLSLTSERGVSLRNSVLVLAYGVPQPPQNVLEGEVTAGLAYGGDWQFGLELEGPLSDFSRLEVLLSADQWRSSSVAVDHSDFRVQFGNRSENPYRVRLPADFGPSGSYRWGEWSLAAALGWVEENRFSGYLAGGYETDTLSAAAGVGMRRGQFTAGTRVERRFERRRWSLDGRWRDSTFDTRFQWRSSFADGFLDGYAPHTLFDAYRTRTDEETPQIDFVSDLSLGSGDSGLTATATMNFPNVGVRYRTFLDLPFDGDPATFRTGTVATLPRETERVVLDLLAGTDEGHLLLGVAGEGAGLSLSSRFGVFYDTQGAGYRIAGNLTRSPNDALRFDLNQALNVYPALSIVDSSAELRGVFRLAPYDAYVSARWSTTETVLGLTGGLVYTENPWSVSLLAGSGYDYGADTWTNRASLEAAYLFTLRVPEALTRLAGGRRVGSLRGRVRTQDGAPLPGVELRLGRYTLKTDEAGQFSADLPPDTYLLKVATETLPITYRLQGDAERSLEIFLRETLEVEFVALETAVLEGTVLQDSDADGVPDTPPVGVEAAFVLTNSEGLIRNIQTGADGRFQIRGLLPGEVSLRLSSQPIGNRTVGEDTRTLHLSAGEISNLTFLSQPAQARARSFTASRLRIRRVETEVERSAPGSAPLIYVSVQGEAETVTLETPAESVPLSFAGDTWSGRLALPAEASAGVFAYTVIARLAEDETQRQGQIIIDPALSPLEGRVAGPARPGAPLEVSAVLYLAAERVSAASSFGTIALSERAAGRWQGELEIPQNTPDGIYSVTLTAQAGDASYEQTLNFRVLVTEDE